MKTIFKFFRESYEELRKVVWPTRENLLRHTLTVLVSVAVAMLILLVVDFGLKKGVELLVNLNTK